MRPKLIFNSNQNLKANNTIFKQYQQLVIFYFRKTCQRHTRIPSISIEPAKPPDEPVSFTPSPTRVCIITFCSKLELFIVHFFEKKNVKTLYTKKTVICFVLFFVNFVLTLFILSLKEKLSGPEY